MNLFLISISIDGRDKVTDDVVIRLNITLKDANHEEKYSKIVMIVVEKGGIREVEKI